MESVEATQVQSVSEMPITTKADAAETLALIPAGAGAPECSAESSNAWPTPVDIQEVLIDYYSNLANLERPLEPGDFWTTASEENEAQAMQFVLVHGKIEVTHVYPKNADVGPAVSYRLLNLSADGGSRGIAI